MLRATRVVFFLQFTLESSKVLSKVFPKRIFFVEFSDVPLLEEFR